MRLFFVDFAGWDYTIDTPYRRPLGGSQSALCYLAEELARLGHEVWLLNGIPAAMVSRGVRVAPIGADESRAALAAADAVIVLNGCSLERAAALRRLAGDTALLLYWTQHADDQPASGNLGDPMMRGLWDAFVLISDWQAERYRTVFGLPAERVAVLRNAIGPSFRNLYVPGTPVAKERTEPPVLAYTSTPFRGLDILVAAFPRIRAAIPGTRLQVFSSMAVYQVDSRNDGFAELYERCRTTEGIEYVGSLPQPELAGALRRATCLSYPNTFAETSCIAVMEAMAAGCLVVTSSLGALPETLGGFGFPMAPPSDPRTYAERFADRTVQVLRLVAGEPARTECYLADQVRYVNEAATWPIRARQWSAWLAERVSAKWGERMGEADAMPLAARLPGRTPLGGGRTLTTGRHGVYVSTGTSADERALQRRGEPDGALADLLCAALRPSDTVVEIGAGLGTLTVPMARRVGTGGMVVALEPRPEAFSLLCATLVLNGLLQACPRPLPADGYAALATELPACRLLRIDAGGHEAQALAAAEPLIERFRPLLHSRVRGPAAFAALDDIGRRFGYRLFWHGFRAAADEAPQVGIFALPAVTLGGADGTPATAFEQAATLFPGFAATE